MSGSSWSGRIVDHPTMAGYHRMGRGPRRILRGTRLELDPPLVGRHGVGHVDEEGEPIDQPSLRAARAKFRAERRTVESLTQRLRESGALGDAVPDWLEDRLRQELGLTRTAGTDVAGPFGKEI